MVSKHIFVCFVESKSFEFAVRIVKLYRYFCDEKKEYVLSKQLLRSGTSIGANIHEGNYASSKADFLNKFQISLKECYKTDYWLEIFKDAEMISKDKYEDLYFKCSKIRKLLATSITTAKGKNR